MDWYVARDGETYGPFPFDVLVKGVHDGEMTPEDLVWSDGMLDWQPAATIAGLFLPPSSPPPLATVENARALIPVAASSSAMGIQEGSQPARKTSSGGLIRRHWRGELSLPSSYWGVGIAVTLWVMGLGRLFAAAVETFAPGSIRLNVALAAFLTFLCACAVWQLVGVWRSATRYMQRSRPKVWGVLARIAVFIGIVCAGVDFHIMIDPVLSGSGRFTSQTEKLPAHRLRLMRDGTEVELAGGMPRGTAAALRKLLDATPGVQVVHLNSIGGKVAEGYEIYQLMRDRNLITYTATDCVSACTIAFLGGSQRLLSTRGRLGFHSLSIGGVDQRYVPEINAEVRRTLLDHGAPEWFVTKALTTRSDSMWYPTKSELTAAKIVTDIVDPDQFGLSGITNWHDQQAVERDLLTLPLYALVRNNDPDVFTKIAGRISEGVKLGKSVIEITQESQSIAEEILPKYIMLASDDAVHRYWKTQVREVEYLSNTDPVSCVEYLFPQLRRKSYNLHSLLPGELLKDDVEALTSLVEEAIKRPTSSNNPTNVEEEVDQIIARVTAEIPGAHDLITEPLNHTQEPKRLCSAFLAMYSVVMNLSPEKSAAIVRSMLDPNR
jgi:hypothetical protein